MGKQLHMGAPKEPQRGPFSDPQDQLGRVHRPGVTAHFVAQRKCHREGGCLGDSKVKVTSLKVTDVFRVGHFSFGAREAGDPEHIENND